MTAIVGNIVLYHQNFLRVKLKCPYQSKTERSICKVSDSIGVKILPNVCAYHITTLYAVKVYSFVHYLSKKLRK